MPTSSSLMKTLRVQEDRSNLEQENSNGEFQKIKSVFEKRIKLYLRYLAEDDLTELERLMLSNEREWQRAHLLGLIEHEDMINKLSELTKRVYQLEKQQQAITFIICF
jgi:hypothetical protein